ncbi:hypothetical protein Snoj_04420 [Streptomyces nojiriensis]|uniref:Uncharacterized protein n=1 Tax=Streptomyces nojiriensis TaxID=66374 RepID=A0ABQ3SEH5_9ACTN|nr:hypothetical protein [Streptomyces nojiriensis]QTI48174.1 sporulation protein [Streptomyces nojiriensis]GGS25899.1 hypothetical protein GCM10010205_64890 [Streptomyces nojiriensis]GHI66524.1 hypothetical protein Snoj_04420 [Streptomyces nojiriensis]
MDTRFILKRSARPASRALKASDDLISQADQSSGYKPAWIDSYHHARLSADAAEVFRDLKNPKASLAWNQRAAAMPSGVFTRSVGMRLAIVGTAHLQACDLDHGLSWATAPSLSSPASSPPGPMTTPVSSTWPSAGGGVSQPSKFIHRTRTELGIAA